MSSIFWGWFLEKNYKRFPRKKWRKFFYGDFHVKLEVSFKFFTRDFHVNWRCLIFWWIIFSLYKKNFFLTRKSLVTFFQKSSPNNWTHLQFYKRNPYKKIIFNFTKEIHLKFLRFSAKGWILQEKSLEKFSGKKLTLEFGLKNIL